MRADDRAAFEQLRLVTNVSAVHSFHHYLYFADERSAKNVARILREQGLEVQDRLGADDINWLVLAQIYAVPTEANISTTAALFERIAAEHGGEYDGWEADAQPL
jgi:hypothetical protein